MSLKWNEVRPDEDCISLPDTKNGRSRMVHLHAWAKGVVQELHEKRGMRFGPPRASTFSPPGRGRRRGTSSTTPSPRPVSVRGSRTSAAGVQYTFVIMDVWGGASMAVRGGASLFDVQKLLGHQCIAMTQATPTYPTMASGS